jgi:hypothetical protein
MIMGLFWGSKKENPAPPPPQQRELTEHEKLMQKLTQPLELGYVTGCGPASASPDFTYLIRNINDGVHKNNNIVREIRELVRGLAEENHALKQRVEQLEQQISKVR